jgi:hypothetical protein
VQCNFSNGATCSITYNSTGAVLTIDAPLASASHGGVSGSPAKRVSRGMMADASVGSTHDPVAILSRAACFGARMLMAPAACGSDTLATVASGGERHAAATAGSGSGAVHNIMVATRAISAAQGGASHESSGSASAMARLYVCAYMPSSAAHTMGCN